MHKGQQIENMKTHYEFGNDPMKKCFNHKTRMKVVHRIKNIIKKFYHANCYFLWNIFCHEFSMFGYAFFFFLLHYGLHSLKVLHNK
jgi:hypothetical protein